MPIAACSKVHSRRCPGPPRGTAYSAVHPGTADDGASRISESGDSNGLMRSNFASGPLQEQKEVRPRGGYSSSSSFLSGGILQAVTPTTPSVTIPPKITERTAPRSFAATPDSNDPISLEDPMNI